VKVRQHSRQTSFTLIRRVVDQQRATKSNVSTPDMWLASSFAIVAEELFEELTSAVRRCDE
jgi:hypothetical protein